MTRAEQIVSEVLAAFGTKYDREARSHRRAVEKVAHLFPPTRTLGPKRVLPVLFACQDCRYGEIDEAIEPHEAQVCGHPDADMVSAGSPVLTDHTTRPAWCPYEASR